jgi:hypothetical protein
MQLYNTLSAKERANLIDQAGEDRPYAVVLQIRTDRKPKVVSRLSLYSLGQAQCFGSDLCRN